MWIPLSSVTSSHCVDHYHDLLPSITSPFTLCVMGSTAIRVTAVRGTICA